LKGAKVPLKDYIETTAVFTTRDYLRTCGNTQTNRNLLSRAFAAGKIHKVKHGLHASNSGKYRDVIHNKYDIITAAAPDAILCYDSAFELFTGQHAIVLRTAFFTARQAKPFEFQGRVYQPFSAPKKPMKTRGYRQSNGAVVKGTTPEQTIIDSLSQPNRCLGIENVLRSIATVNNINIKELLAILEEETTPVKSRLGWVLEQKQTQWQIPGEEITALQNLAIQGPFYFTPSHVRAKDAYDSKWKLYFSEPIATMKEWING
jgi:predicted transcriptional regulator of viral defense system